MYRLSCPRIDFLVPVRVYAPLKGSVPRKSYFKDTLVPGTNAWELMYFKVNLGCSTSFKVNVGCSTSYLICKIQLNTYFIAHISQKTLILHWKKSKQEYWTTFIRVKL